MLAPLVFAGCIIGDEDGDGEDDEEMVADTTDVQSGPTDDVAHTEQEVVYGTDNRQDVYAHSDLSFSQLARRSGVTLMNAGTINASNPNNITFNASSLGASLNLCTSERFRDDPRAGFCSGTLIDDDLVLTAGHCINANTCSNTRLVFNFYRDAAGSLATVTSTDVFQCASVVVREQATVNGQNLDYAIVRLDRRATPRFTPAPVRQDRSALATGQRVGMIGAPSGIPLKLDTGGSVRNARSSVLDYFVATTDSFGGNSGSGVYELDGYRVAGILVRGETDYVWDGGCRRVNVCTETGCRGEDVTYVGPALDDLCDTAPTSRLCTPRNWFSYSAQDTNYALRNTERHFVHLDPGQTLDAGTCGIAGSTGSGDTYLRLYGPDGAELTSNDDASGCGLLSKLSFTAPPLQGGLYELRAGCWSSTSCSGTLAYTKRGPLAGSYSYSTSDTASATRNTVNFPISLSAGQTITFGTCGLDGAEGTGDTYLRLYNAAGAVVASNDDYCWLLSRASYRAPQAGTYEIRAGCFYTRSCSGTVAYTVTNSGTLPFSAADTSSATRNTANFDLYLEAGQTIVLGTCGVAGAYGVGDTLLRLYNSSGTQVGYNDDSSGCGLLSSLSYKATTAGWYQLRAGCFSSSSCSGAVGYTRTSNSGRGVQSYSASNTSSATVATADRLLHLEPGQIIDIGTCGVAGAWGNGDTYLRFFGPDSRQVAISDDACGLLSKFTYVVPSNGRGAYTIRAGCFSSTSCSGGTAYEVR